MPTIFRSKKMQFSAANFRIFRGAAEMYIEGGKINFYFVQILNETNNKRHVGNVVSHLSLH